MKKQLSILSVISVLILGAIPLLGAGAPQRGGNQGGGDRVCVYQDIQFQGWEECYRPGDEIADLGRHKNAISSIRIYGRARIMVFKNSEFEGNSEVFDRDVPDLGRRNMEGRSSWSDQIDSLRVDYEFRNSGRNNPEIGRSVPPVAVPGRGRGLDRDGVCVYERKNFEGREECFRIGEDDRDLGSRHERLSDRISSIRVFGNAVAVLYRDIQFRGEELIVERDIPDLGRVRMRGFQSWENQASSIVVERARGGRGRGRNPWQR